MAAFDLPASQGLFVSSYGHLARGTQAACPLVQHAVCLLPLSEENRAAYERIVRRIEEYGGEASILKTSSPSEEWQERTVARFNAARDEEVIDETERFQEEIAREKRKGEISLLRVGGRGEQPRTSAQVPRSGGGSRRLWSRGPGEGGGGSGALR